MSTSRGNRAKRIRKKRRGEGNSHGSHTTPSTTSRLEGEDDRNISQLAGLSISHSRSTGRNISHASAPVAAQEELSDKETKCNSTQGLEQTIQHLHFLFGRVRQIGRTRIGIDLVDMEDY